MTAIKAKTKAAKEREAAQRIAQTTARYFDELPKTEQKIRLKAIKVLTTRIFASASRTAIP